MATRLDSTTRNEMATAMAAALDTGSGAGTLAVYTGSQPASAGDAASGTKLLEFTCNDPMFAVSGATLTLDVSPALTANGLADGTAGWARFTSQDGTRRLDGAVGSEVTLSDTTVETGQPYTVTGATYTVGA